MTGVPGAQAIRYYVTGAILAGAIWGAESIMYFDVAPPGHRIFLAFAIGGMTLGSANAYSAHPPTFFAFAVCSGGTRPWAE